MITGSKHKAKNKEMARLAPYLLSYTVVSCIAQKGTSITVPLLVNQYFFKFKKTRFKEGG